MAKHTLRDILSIFAKHAEHTHEAAVQATYDAGHAQGRAEAKAEFEAGLATPAPAPQPPEGAPSDDSQKVSDEERAKAEKDAATKTSEGSGG